MPSPKLLDITPRPRPYALDLKLKALGMTSKAARDLKCEMQHQGTTKGQGPCPKPLSFKQSLSQGVAQLSQIFVNLCQLFSFT